MQTNDKSSLLVLLENFSIEIPIIQRDYAQGRNGAEHIRRNLLNDIETATNGKGIVDLQFVYGKTEDNKFIPVDGQQRLTTLFLLHLYAFYDDETKTDIFKRFSYKARYSTDDFLQVLIEKRYEVFDSSDSPKELILDAEWFFDSWKYDPSVKSMLNMLEAIVKQGFDREKLKNEFNKQGDELRIFFRFVNPQKLGKEDDLYIKLNARGLKLTDFENFKSKFIDFCLKNHETFYRENIEQKIDGDWSRAVWKMNNKRYDYFYLKIFELFFSNYGILDFSGESADDWYYNVILDGIDEKFLRTFCNFMNYYSYSGSTKACEKIKNTIIAPKTYYERISFHVLAAYLSDKDNWKAIDEDSFNTWIRVFDHLIINTRIDRPEQLKKEISFINQIKAQNTSILDCLSGLTDYSDSGFLNEQLEEECQKARLILADPANISTIISAEDRLKYFQGQLRGIMKLSDFWNNNNVTLFNEYVDKLDMLFEEKTPRHETLLKQTLCALGDYRLDVGDYKTLCISDQKHSNKTPSFKHLFSEGGEIVEELLQKIDLKTDIETQLNSIKSSAVLQQDDWRYCFVNYPSLFGEMFTQSQRMFYNNKEWILVPNVSTRGKNNSLYLSALLCELNAHNVYGFEKHNESGAWNERCLQNGDIEVTYSDIIGYTITDNNNTYSFSGNNLITDTTNKIIELLNQ